MSGLVGEEFRGPLTAGNLWSAGGRRTPAGLDLLDVDSSHRTSLTSRGVDYLPAFSPDGKWVAFKREVAGSAQEVLSCLRPAAARHGSSLRMCPHHPGPYLDCGQPRVASPLPRGSPPKAVSGEFPFPATFRAHHPAGLRSVSYPNVARQGRLLAFNEAWTDSNVHVWTGTGIPRSGTSWHFGAATVMINSTRADHSPAISPERRRIAFVSESRGGEVDPAAVMQTTPASSSSKAPVGTKRGGGRPHGNQQ